MTADGWAGLTKDEQQVLSGGIMPIITPNSYEDFVCDWLTGDYIWCSHKQGKLIGHIKPSMLHWWLILNFLVNIPTTRIPSPKVIRSSVLVKLLWRTQDLLKDAVQQCLRYNSTSHNLCVKWTEWPALSTHSWQYCDSLVISCGSDRHANRNDTSVYLHNKLTILHILTG